MKTPLNDRITQLRPRLTWLERMPKRWPAKVLA